MLKYMVNKNIIEKIMKFILDLLSQGAVLLGIFFIIKMMCFNRPNIKLDNSVYEQSHFDRIVVPVGKDDEIL